MRFGVGLGADTTPEDLPGIVDYLESSGADSVWFSELVYSPAVDPFIGMAYTLSRTTRLKAGTSVAILPGRHPVLVAKQVASLAALAPRRVLPAFGLHSALTAERDVFTVPRARHVAPSSARHKRRAARSNPTTTASVSRWRPGTSPTTSMTWRAGADPRSTPPS